MTRADTAYDVAVVGAGVSGAYAAFRLQQQQIGARRPKRIALFNYDNRIGGRLLTRTMPGMPHVHAELGGMRFIPGNQFLTTGLIDLLQLPVRDFPMGNPNPAIGSNDNFMYLRGQNLLVSDLTDPSKVPYNLSWFERGQTPDALTSYMMNLFVPNAASLTLSEWFNVEVLGKPLYRYGLWELFYMALSSEGFEFVQDAGGYDSNVANANAVATLPPHHSATATYQTLVGGYDLLPKSLVRQFERWGGTVCLNHRLASFGRTPGRGATGRYRLNFRRTATRGFRTRDLPSAGPSAGDDQIVHADRIVLALPRRALELIDNEWLSRDAAGAANVASVLIQPAFKLFLGYPYPWWRELGLVAGRSITDMPIRQTYYFGTEGEQPGANPENLNSLMMVSYNDVEVVPFWKGFERDPPFEGYRPRFVPRGRTPVPPAQFDATRGMVEMAQRLVREMHGQKTLPDPYAALYHDWSGDPYGGGWHKWKPGVRFDRLMKTMRCPVPDEAIHVCGEAYSNYQGWVEGALQTAELMLEEHFGLSRPDWLPADYDLGP